MSENLITINERNKFWIQKLVSAEEVRGRWYTLLTDPSTKSGYRWTRVRDVTIYQHEDEVWRTYPEREMRRWIADFDIREDWES